MSQPEPCRPAGRCQSYRSGHQTHWIHAKHVGRTPWGWRDGLVVALDGGWVTLDYLESGRRLRLWHHQALAGEVRGRPVRVHEQYRVLGGPFGWVHVLIEGGAGPVPAPADPAWAGQATGAVTDLSTGRAVALDWLATEESGDRKPA